MVAVAIVAGGVGVPIVILREANRMIWQVEGDYRLEQAGMERDPTH